MTYTSRSGMCSGSPPHRPPTTPHALPPADPSLQRPLRAGRGLIAVSFTGGGYIPSVQRYVTGGDRYLPGTLVHLRAGGHRPMTDATRQGENESHLSHGWLVQVNHPPSFSQLSPRNGLQLPTAARQRPSIPAASLDHRIFGHNRAVRAHLDAAGTASDQSHDPPSVDCSPGLPLVVHWPRHGYRTGQQVSAIAPGFGATRSRSTIKGIFAVSHAHRGPNGLGAQSTLRGLDFAFLPPESTPRVYSGPGPNSMLVAAAAGMRWPRS